MTEIAVTTLVEALANTLRNQVVSGELAPGTRVTEQSVAAQHDVARPTAKAAIERVVQSGVLRRTANKTARVPELTKAEAADLYRSRLLIEHGVVRYLALNHIVPTVAQSALFDMKRAVELADIIAAVDADARFHTALVSASGSERITRAYDGLMGEARLLMAQERAGSEFQPFPHYEDHREILLAVESSQPELAQTLIIRHYVTAARRVLGEPLDITGWV
ncbi:MAG: GntR family transcriptional regulator [Propionibacteriaceae bacterium]|jgi:DNA-binding GntR family transcriptional regulator|nr:GntR family transcriptional regulator [Propionibacteriaceae bacterium]